MDDGVLDYGDKAAQVVSARSAVLSTLATLKSLTKGQRADGMKAHVAADGSNWRFSAASATAGDDILVAEPSDAPSAGRWLRTDKTVEIRVAFDFNQADASAIYTVPAGFRLFIERAFWEITVSFTGGAASAIGLSSDNGAYNTKGDILGGAGGDVAAGLTSTVPGPFTGTAGAKATKPIVLNAGNEVRFDRITSAFTAGSGFVRVVANLVA